MNKVVRACIAQPIDRAYNLHGGGRHEHLEFFQEPVSYAIRAQVAPMVAEWINKDEKEVRNSTCGNTRQI